MTRLRKYLPHLLLVVAALFLLSVILDVYRGKPFVLDLILGVVSALCAVSFVSKRRAGGVITSFHELRITRTERAARHLNFQRPTFWCNKMRLTSVNAPGFHLLATGYRPVC